MNRKEAMLCLLASADGEPFTSTQLQKAMFLIDQEIGDVIEGNRYNFQPYDYGPFDKDIYADIEKLEDEKLAMIFETARHMVYYPTPKGIVVGKDLLEELPKEIAEYIKKIAEYVLSRSFKELVLEICQAYPEMGKNNIFN